MYEKLNKLQDELWGYAETGFTEVKSAKAMADVLESEGFKVTRGIANMPTAYVGEYGSGKPVICFLAEYDALFGLNQVADLAECKPITNNEDTGHGCGHHILGVGSIAGAIEYKNYLKENNLPGTIKMVGCPAEESGSGKAYLARDGYFNDADIVLTWHPGSLNQVSSGCSLSCISVFFKFKGIASHAAGAPHLGRSALDACELMNVGVNYLREHMEPTERVHYAYLNAGGKSPNVVQSEAVLKYFIRSTTNPKCQKLYDRVIDCAKGAALMTGTELEVIFDEGLSNVVTNEVLENVLADSFRKCYNIEYTAEELAYAQSFKDTYNMENAIAGVSKKVVDQQRLKDSMRNSPICDYFVETMHSEDAGGGSTDVGDVSWCIPTAQFGTACFAYGAGAHSWQWVAQGKSSISKKGYQLAGHILADAAKTIQANPEIIEKAWEELNRKLDGDKYKSLIPDDVMPHVSTI